MIYRRAPLTMTFTVIEHHCGYCNFIATVYITPISRKLYVIH